LRSQDPKKLENLETPDILEIPENQENFLAIPELESIFYQRDILKLTLDWVGC